jgi:hypothetical protein
MEGASSKSVVSFLAHKSIRGAPSIEARNATDESIAVSAGRFDCVKVVEAEQFANRKTTTWVHKEFADLIVKSISTSDRMDSTTELIELKD